MQATMTINADSTTASSVDGAGRDRPATRRGDIRARMAGLGALTFVGTVVLQNAIRGSSAPANGASGQDVLSYYADHRAVTAVLAVSFVLGGLGMATFVGGVMRRLTASSRPGWAYTGLAGVLGIVSIFSVLVAAEEALSVVGTSAHPNVAAIDALWALHNSVFTVLFLSIAVALVGLSRAGVAAGITPRHFERLAPIGAGLLVLACAAGPFIAAGDAMPLFGVGAVGFVVWLAFLATTGLRLVRAEALAID